MQQQNNDKRCRIGLAAIFLPRMEMDHLGEWVEYHLGIGIHRVYLYNNRHRSIDGQFGDHTGGKTWAKKPEANYHLDLSDEDVDTRIGSVLRAFGRRAIHCLWPSGVGHRTGLGSAQMAAVNHQLRRQERQHEVHWLGHLDIDELLVCPSGNLRKAFEAIPREIAMVSLPQYLFESRWKDGGSVPYTELTTCLGAIRFNRKVFARIGKVRRWVNPHQVVGVAGKRWRPPFNILRFHHFRGNQHFGPPPPNGWMLNRIQQITGDRSFVDDAHVRHAVRRHESIAR